MLKRIIERHNKTKPLSQTEIQIIQSATRLFLKQGFSKTTHRQIAEESGIGLGTITYHYRTKEDLLLVLIEELMDFHLDVIEASEEEFQDPFLSCAMEVAVQIALCENNEMAWDLYYSAYSHEPIFEYIKQWAAQKNYHLLKEKLPQFTQEDFAKLEHVASGIELAAFSAPCNRYFTLKEKITLFLDAIMKIYDVSEAERSKIIRKVLALNCEKIAREMFEKFINRLP